MPKTKAWKVYGAPGHRQKESFGESTLWDFSSEREGTRIIEVLREDKTGTNDYVIVKITRDTYDLCDREMSGQITDGLFENSRVGDVEEISPKEV